MKTQQPRLTKADYKLASILQKGNDTEFSRHIRKRDPKKLRQCLRCGTKFVSSHYGNRLCGQCCMLNSRASHWASQGI